MRFVGLMAQLFIFGIVGLSLLLLGYERFGHLLRVRPDRNLSYTFAVRTPQGELLNFTGASGCEFVATPDAGGYRTLNPTAQLTVAGVTWRLEGIDCAQALGYGGSPDYALYRIDSARSARKHFIAAGGPVRVGGGTAESTLFGALDTTAPPARYELGPYFFRRFSLNAQPAFAATLTQPVVLFDGSEACAELNAPAKRLALSETQRTALTANYASYTVGHLEFSEANAAWTLAGPLDPDAGFPVAAALAGDTPDTLPAECVRIEYQGEQYVLSAYHTGAMLYLPDVNAVLRTEYIDAADFQLALRRAGEWQACTAPLPATGSIAIERGGHVASSPSGQNKLDRLVRNEAGAALCIRNSDYQWL